MFRSVPVLCYHNVSEGDGHTPERFAEHLDVLAEGGWRTISGTELYRVVRGEMPAPERAVVLTFDDAHISNWLTVAPMLRQRNMTGVFFAVTDFIHSGGKRTAADVGEVLPLPQSFIKAIHGDTSQFMTGDELRSMVDDYGFEVFSHSATHQGCIRRPRPIGLCDGSEHWGHNAIYPEMREDYPAFAIRSAYAHNGFWPRLNGHGAKGTPPQNLLFRQRNEEERSRFCSDQFRRSLERIRDINRADIQLFCWPWGHYDAVSEAALKRAGYHGAFTLERGANARGTDPFRLNRLGIAKNKDGKWLRTRLKMYSSEASARFFFKFFNKRPDLRSVLLTTHSVKVSGGSRQMVNNARALVEAGMDVHVVVPSNSKILSALQGCGVTLATFDEFTKVGRAARFFGRYVEANGIDVVHAFHTKAYKPLIVARLKARLCGKKTFRLFINRGVIFKPNALMGLWSVLSDGIICNSAKCADVLRKYMVPKGRMAVVYNSFVPEGRLCAAPVQRKKRGARILWVGGTNPAKGPDVFFKAVAAFCQSGEARDVEFVVAGINDISPYLELVPREHRQRVRSTGVIPQSEVLEEMRFADVLVIPSRQESLPNTLLEAFATGLPVVCTRAGGIPELVRHGVNGYLADIEDHDALAGHIRTLAFDSEQRHRMGLTNWRIATRLLSNRLKGRNLLRVYFGEKLREPLDIEGQAE